MDHDGRFREDEWIDPGVPDDDADQLPPPPPDDPGPPRPPEGRPPDPPPEEPPGLTLGGALLMIAFGSLNLSAIALGGESNVVPVVIIGGLFTALYLGFFLIGAHWFGQHR